MHAPIGSQISLHEQIRSESKRVLEDPIFKRAPVQRKLLQYLVDRALSDGPAPSQFEIAVDALGKDSDFDLASDSYPRVQMSRLRSNLDKYYALNKPLNGFRLVLGNGEYSVTLAQVDQPNSPPQSESALSQNALLADEEERAAKPEVRRKLKMDAAFSLGALSVAALLVLTVSYWSPSTPSELQASQALNRPSIEFISDSAPMREGQPRYADEVRAAIDTVRSQLASSLVSGTSSGGENGHGDYKLSLSFGLTGANNLEANLALRKLDETLLFYDVIRLDPDNPDSFQQEIRAAVTFVTSPTGAVSKDQLQFIDKRPRSAYGCFILMENQRADGQAIVPLVEQCITDFPESNYSSFFFARRAFSYYQVELLGGRPIERSGQGWRDLNNALRLDRYNAFANFTAAKVELAVGDCDGARIHINQAFERSVTYPALVAALEAEASSCPIFDDHSTIGQPDLGILIDTNSSPDSVLYLYLMLAALSVGDLDSAHVVTNRPRVYGASGLEEDTIELVEKGLSDREFARRNADRIEAKVAVFIWSDSAVRAIMQSLTSPPVEPIS